MNRTRGKWIILILAAVMLVCSLLIFVLPKFVRAFPDSREVLSRLHIAPDYKSDRIIFLNVGQGDGALIISDGHAALIDCGTAQDDGIALTAKLRKYGASSIDYIFISHPHSDHCGGASAVAANNKIGAVILPDYSPESNGDSAVWQDFLENSADIPKEYYSESTEYAVGNFKIETVQYCPGMSEENDRSAVLKITLGEYSALFCGDIEAEGEAALDGKSINADILKIPHHGSATSASDKLLSLVNPQYAVISVGENSFGHPSQKVLDRLGSRNITTIRTDVNGDIIFSFDGGITLKAEF